MQHLTAMSEAEYGDPPKILALLGGAKRGSIV